MRSCLDWYKRGVKNGAYEIVDWNDKHYPVFCDFESEATSVWTLITSHSLAKKDFFKLPLYKDSSRNEDNPNWMDYRYTKYLSKLEKVPKFLRHTENSFSSVNHQSIKLPIVTERLTEICSQMLLHVKGYF